MRFSRAWRPRRHLRSRPPQLWLCEHWPHACGPSPGTGPSCSHWLKSCSGQRFPRPWPPASTTSTAKRARPPPPHSAWWPRRAVQRRRQARAHRRCRQPPSAWLCPLSWCPTPSAQSSLRCWAAQGTAWCRTRRPWPPGPCASSGRRCQTSVWKMLVSCRRAPDTALFTWPGCWASPRRAGRMRGHWSPGWVTGSTLRPWEPPAAAVHDRSARLPQCRRCLAVRPWTVACRSALWVPSMFGRVCLAWVSVWSPWRCWTFCVRRRRRWHASVPGLPP
mmetsp:Transcript_48387/g.144488  ORF Transcript_48387/g.144488 Transcript_48387/m.144488 type:complete len:276 (-) Transcript_48387:866-1693(-)